MMAWGASFYRRRIISKGIERRAHGRSPLDASTSFFFAGGILHFTLLVCVCSFSIGYAESKACSALRVLGNEKLVVIDGGDVGLERGRPSATSELLDAGRDGVGASGLLDHVSKAVYALTA